MGGEQKILQLGTHVPGAIGSPVPFLAATIASGHLSPFTLQSLNACRSSTYRDVEGTRPCLLLRKHEAIRAPKLCAHSAVQSLNSRSPQRCLVRSALMAIEQFLWLYENTVSRV